MAKISLDLGQFKASGIYTLEFDASESIILNTQTIRLILGFSRKGPFNAPVYLPDKKTARTVFGDIDSFLERRGSFFHRALYTALEIGPVFGLNLMPLNNDPDLGDKIPYYSYSISSTEKNGKKVWKLLSSFYNKERFWAPDQSYFLGNVNSPGSINTGKLFNVTNLSQTPVSIVMRKAKVLGFDITAREWYKAGNVPTFIDDWDYISDYFIEVIVVQGDWTNYQALAVDPIWSEYFDMRGLKKAKINEFLGAPEVSVIGSFTGSIIPDLVDGNGITHSIDTIINSSLVATGLYVSIDKEALENYDLSANEDDNDQISAVDMIGHNFADPNRENPDIIDFLSYKTTIKEALSFSTDSTFTIDDINFAEGTIITESIHKGKSYGYFNNIIKIEKPPYSENASVLHPDLLKYVTIRNLTVPGQSLIKLAKATGTEEIMIAEAEGQVPAEYKTVITYDPADTDKYGIIDSVSEYEDPLTGKIYLKLLWKHPDKLDEKNNHYYNFKEVDYATGKIIIDSSSALHADPIPGEDVIIENKTTKTWYYFKVTDYSVEDGDLISAEVPEVPEVPAHGVPGDPDYTPLVPAVPAVPAVYEQIKTLIVEKTDALKKWDILFTEAVRQPAGYQISWESGISAYLPVTSSDGFPWTIEAGGSFFTKMEYVMEPDVVKHVAATTPSADTQNYIVAYKYSKVYQYYEDGALMPGDKWYYHTAPEDYFYLDYQRDIDANGVSVLKIYAYDTFIDGKLEYAGSGDHGYAFTVANNYVRDEDGGDSTISTSPNFTIYVVADNLYDYIPTISWDSSKTKFTVSETNGSLIQVGHYIVAEVKDTDGNSFYKLTKVSNKKKIYNDQIDGWAFEYTVNQPIQLTNISSIMNVTRYFPLESFILNYQMIHLDGFKLNEYHLPGGLHKQTQLEKILGMLDPLNSNLMEMLKSRDVITFRYVVDTFDGGLNTYTYPKCWITRLAKERQKCLAIMNAPSIKEFVASNNPRFTDEPTRVDPKPILNTRYIADGGNLSLGPDVTFTLPDEFWGSKFAGYFAPFITIRENGKNFDIPPAAHVSNLFVQKFINGNPYSIVAGPRRGVISEPKMVGLEYDFLQKDREYIEPMGLNPIVKKKGVGYMIFGNQMAYQKTSSAFNNLHVRDLLITIEEAIEDILTNYLFEFNDSSTRLEIKTITETYMDGVRSNGGVYDFLVIMDESNNPNDIIDQNIGIIDVAIEPVRGLHKFINRITVMKTGGIASGGFTMV